jgi:argininosuccinate lyase
MVIRSRLENEMDKFALQLTSSLEHDWYIWMYDIAVDIAHVLGLLKTGHLSDTEAAKIVAAILEVADRIEKEEKLPDSGEDIHEAIEASVIEIAGETGMKMHTARSRNDEVATCLRMFARDGLVALAKQILELRENLLERAEEHINTLMPGFTHLQYAQPTKLSHHLIAIHDMFDRCFERCLHAFKRVNLCPLGSAAFASTSFKLDRKYVADLLGFDGIVENSEDAVASRDFLIESIFVAVDGCLALSRLAEEIVLWASEFDFVELPDEYSSSSSIMPQKKNPDVAEIVRAKAGKLIGNLTAVMSIYKAMPFSYNRDFQEMNSILYESFRDTCLAFKVMADMISKLNFKTKVMEKKASKGFAVATRIAEELTKMGVPFRKSHRIVGKLSRFYRKQDFDLYNKFVEVADEEGIKIPDFEVFRSWLDVRDAVESRNNVGGTSEKAIVDMLKFRKRRLEEDKKKIGEIEKKIDGVIEKLREKVLELLKS